MRFATSVSILAAAVVAGTTAVIANEIEDTNSVLARDFETDLVLEARSEAIDNYTRELEVSDLKLREFSEGYTELEARKRSKKNKKGRKGKKHGSKKQKQRPEVAPEASGAEGGGAEGGEAPVQEGREYLEGRARRSSKTGSFRKVVNGKNINKAADMLVTANKVANQFSPSNQENGRRSDDEYLAMRDYLEARTKSNRVRKSKSNNNRPKKSQGPSRSRSAGKLLGAGVGLYNKLRPTGPLPSVPPPEPEMVGRDEGVVLDARDLLALNEELEMRED